MSRKNTLRRITIDGNVFYWKADWSYWRYRPGDSAKRIIHVRVWGGNKSSRPLYADLYNPYRQTHMPMPWADWTDDSYVMPKDVRAIIDYGLAHGWDPLTRGEPYRLTSADALTLEKLALTDPGHDRAVSATEE